MEIIREPDQMGGEKFQNPYSLTIEAYIRRGWEIIRKRLDYFVLFTLIFFIGSSIPLGALFLMQSLAAGFLLVAFYIVSGREIVFENFFDGFKYFAALLLFSLVSTLLIFVGFLALILPGIYLSVGYIFTPFFIVFRKMDFWQAMEASRKLVHPQWFSIFGFLLVLALINLLGFLALGVGLLITVPLSYCALYAAFDDIVGV